MVSQRTLSLVEVNQAIFIGATVQDLQTRQASSSSLLLNRNKLLREVQLLHSRTRNLTRNYSNPFQSQRPFHNLSPLRVKLNLINNFKMKEKL